MSETLARDEWLSRVLGFNTAQTPTRPTSSPPVKTVRFAPSPTLIVPPTGPGVKIGLGRSRSKASIVPPRPTAQPKTFDGGNGRSITVAKSPSGKPVFTSPPPPVGEITFSGGGGKGMALPGAVKALQESGVLKGAKTIAGASVGSMTAALVAAGITAEEFTDIANADETTSRIVEGTGGTKKGLAKRALQNKWNTGSANPLTGDGLESVVREVIDTTLGKRIEEYRQECETGGKQVHADVSRISQVLALNKDGATFMDMRQLSAVIPKVKEVVITGTYTTELGTTDKDGSKGFKNQNETGQLYVFSADSEPKLPVAIAVHASASFPAAFKPVDITLASGLKVRFIDGGVMNNTPTASSIGNERKLDPVPETRGMTFVFEDEGGVSGGLLNGVVSPSVGKLARLQDWFVGGSNAGAEYGKNRDMADRPEEIVVVPLQLPLGSFQGQTKAVDMRGGTLEFNVPMDAKIAFQLGTEKATNAQIDRENQDRTREFASDSQMFVSIPMGDLRTLEQNGYDGAAAAVVFRERVAEMIAKLVDAVVAENKKEGGRTANVLEQKDAKLALEELDTLAGDDVDFQGYVAREMNRGSLDNLIAAMDKSAPASKAMQATFAVSDAVRVQTSVGYILKDVVYPKMKRQNEGGSGLQTLLRVETLLKQAKTPKQLNDALDVGIAHFKTKSDARPRRGHKELAEDLKARKMQIAV